MSKKQLSIRVDEDVERELRRIAEAEHRSLNGQVAKALEEWLVANYEWNPPLEETIKGVEEGDIEPAYQGE